MINQLKVLHLTIKITVYSENYVHFSNKKEKFQILIYINIKINKTKFHFIMLVQFIIDHRKKIVFQ
jgi:hypothetical protein